MVYYPSIVIAIIMLNIFKLQDLKDLNIFPNFISISSLPVSKSIMQMSRRAWLRLEVTVHH